MNFRIFLSAVFFAGSILPLSGCKGIVRYKTLGYQESATVNLYDIAPGYLAPLTIPGGIVIDSVILAADVAANPIWALVVVSRGIEPGASFQPMSILVMPVYWCFTPVAMAMPLILNKQFFKNAYGSEGNWLKKQAEENPPANDGTPQTIEPPSQDNTGEPLPESPH